LTISDLRALLLAEARGARFKKFAPANLITLVRVLETVHDGDIRDPRVLAVRRVQTENLLTTNHISHNRKQYTTE
jgi:hypothetical protein